MRNTAESAKVCKALYPGSPAPTVWYGKDHPSLLSLDDLLVATSIHDLVHILPTQDLVLVKTLDDPIHADDYAVLRPSASGALNLIVQAYKRCGGASQIKLLSLTRSLELNGMRDKRIGETKPPQPSFQAGKPLWPPQDKSLHDQFDYHTIGLEFDIERPANARDRMIMDYCIGYFEDRGIVLRMESKAENAWLIVPNPKYAKALNEIEQNGKLPDIRGL